jgi:hypothetical protein
MASTFRSPSDGVARLTALHGESIVNHPQDELSFTYEQALNEKMPKLPATLLPRSYAHSTSAPTTPSSMPFSNSHEMEDPFNTLQTKLANKNDCPVLLSINYQTLQVVVPNYLTQRYPAELHQRAVALLAWFKKANSQSRSNYLSKRVAIPPHIRELSTQISPVTIANSPTASSRLSSRLSSRFGSPAAMELTPGSTPGTSVSSNQSSPFDHSYSKESPLSTQLPPILPPSPSLFRVSLDPISSFTSVQPVPASTPSNLSTLLSASQVLVSPTQDNLMESLYHSLLSPITDLLQRLYPPDYYLLDMYYSTRHNGISVDFSWGLRSCAHCATLVGQPEELLVFAAMKLLPPGVLRAANISEAWAHKGTASAVGFEQFGEPKINSVRKRILQDAWQIHEALKTKGVMFWDGELLFLVEFDEGEISGMLVRDIYGPKEKGYGRRIVLGYLVDALDKVLREKGIGNNDDFWEWEQVMKGVQAANNFKRPQRKER